jgi:hypothetical protein
VTRLRKSDVETLIKAIDSPLLVDAVRTALQRILDVEPFDDDWSALIRYAGERSGWDQERVWSLIERKPTALQSLATELNELRTVAGLS